ncbi:transposase [Paenibacillus maysiensis]|uniref:transposase n=1 Tax=Paenibacillus maysiensis TaxID=1155954 RepID=UPI0009E0474F|nr:transposase [Paenibacillus maysiensis]
MQDQQWRQIQDLFPPERKSQGRRPAVDNRIMLNAMLWVARSGAPWRVSFPIGNPSTPAFDAGKKRGFGTKC